MNSKEQYEKLVEEWLKFCNTKEYCHECKYKGHEDCIVLYLLDNYYLVNKGNGVLK